jgi:hypothetical protein
VLLSEKALSLAPSIASLNLTQCLRHFIIELLRWKSDKKKLFSLHAIGLDLIDLQYISGGLCMVVEKWRGI